jgi:hypothetical protein
MIDTGNMLWDKAAISEKFHPKVGVRLSRVNIASVGTAKKGAKMEALGISRPMELRLEGINKTFTITPLVVPGLTDDINLGTGFLQSIGAGMECSMQFTEEGTTLKVGRYDALLIKVVGGQEEPQESQEEEETPKKPEMEGEERQSRSPRIMTGVKQRRTHEKSVAGRQGGAVYAKEDTKLKGNALKFIEVRTGIQTSSRNNVGGSNTDEVSSNMSTSRSCISVEDTRKQDSNVEPG